MSLTVILEYVLESALFAVAACGVLMLIHLLRGGKMNTRREWLLLLTAAYLAAVAEIIALRFGHASGSRELRLFPPLATTVLSFREGAWSFCFHFFGNTGWFVPLGLLLPMLRPKVGALQALLTGAAFSALLEALQWLLKTGCTDIDDVILNALGALTGYAILRLIRRICARKTPDKKEVVS